MIIIIDGGSYVTSDSGFNNAVLQDSRNEVLQLNMTKLNVVKHIST